mmetsp:Transcript_21966/g.69330  ORF Transcript_21966/g.69330 Transcript_21966/m.69330 type:complete len:316 (-) Transcript_21966:106-1053(-)
MDKLSLLAAVSTDCTRTCTSCPCCSSSSTLSTKPSLICVMCTRPSAVGPPSGRVTVTKAPKGAVLATVPVSHWSGATPSKAERSAAARGAPPEPAGFMERLIRPAYRSTVVIRTCTSWPSSSSSQTFSTKPSLICVTCTRPSAELPSSSVTVTKAPKDCVPRTLPSSHWSGPMPSKADRSAGPRIPPPPGGLMESFICLFCMSTSTIRTCTSWPTSSSSQMFSTKPSLICAMCTRPSADGPPLGNVTVTKAPKGAMLPTVPVCHSSGDTPWKADRSAGELGLLPRPRRPSTMVRSSLPSSLRLLTQTSTSWPSSR